MEPSLLVDQFENTIRSSGANIDALLAFAGAGLAASAAGALVGVELVRDKLFGAVPEVAYSDFLPFLKFADGSAVIECKDGTHFQVIALKGLPSAGVTREEEQVYWNRLKGVVDALSEREVFVRFTTIRRRLSLFEKPKTNEGVAGEISSAWSAQFSRAFDLQHYVSVSVNGGGRSKLKVLKEACSVFLDRMGEWSPATLNRKETLGVLAALVNGNRTFHVQEDHADLSAALVNSSVAIDRSGLVQFEQPFGKRFQTVIGIRGWGEISDARLVRKLLAVPAEMTLIQALKPLPKLRAQGEIAFRHRQNFGLLGGGSKTLELETAADRISSGASTLSEHQLMVLVEADDESELKTSNDAVMRVLASENISAKVETATAERMWWTQYPGLDYLHRPWRLDSENIADLLLGLERQSQGTSRCDWGEGYVRMMPTVGGSAYRFNFHKDEDSQSLGHFLVFGGTGAGKSTLMAFLMLGALESFPDLRTFLFDRNEGFRVFAGVHGFDYLEPGENLELNPFHLGDNPTNRGFLAQWMKLISGAEDPVASAQIDQAINMLMAVSPGERSLSRTFEELFPPNSNLKEAMRPWATGQAASLFNGARDSLSFDGSRLAAFDFTTALEAGDQAAALVSYISHRIRTVGGPHLIFVDEAAPMLGNERFARELLMILREARKKQGVMGLAFQDPEALLASGMQGPFVENVAKTFFFPNPKAQEAAYKPFGLTPDEWAFIKGQSDIGSKYPRAVLVKSTEESVILNVDLRSLGRNLKSLVGGSAASREMAASKRERGREWRDHFLRS